MRPRVRIEVAGLVMKTSDSGVLPEWVGTKLMVTEGDGSIPREFYLPRKNAALYVGEIGVKVEGDNLEEIPA